MVTIICILLIVASLALLYSVLKEKKFAEVSCITVGFIALTIILAVLTLITKFS